MSHLRRETGSYFDPTNGLAVMLCSSGEGWNQLIRTPFQAFSLDAGCFYFSQESQVLVERVALERIGAWRGVDQCRLEKSNSWSGDGSAQAPLI